MDNTQNKESDIISIPDQIDYILQNLDVTPLPGHVIATMCQSRRYIKYLENEFINLGLMGDQLLHNETINNMEDSLNIQNKTDIQESLSEKNNN